jgi:hypothetical protein
MTIQINLVYGVEIENVDPTDYPDFCDAMIGSARWKANDELLTDTELEDLQESNPDSTYELATEAWRDHWGV